ncbi:MULTISPECIES: acyl-CoA dehydrogenase family protein [unclassified Sphingobium]|uniref:acyl-CoA dehydrogenase family protein n=1 Tax=unclassified Sphingobium TaxID=2611147 RepID=UPI000D17B322|nr:MULTISPECIES: acyl-CoA dehydrogenase family protein [unclassified Sphingobium]MBG6120078.1 alkylation response protein AidB-like acyl-CoA dehydrogenase [Sphingobium sp. JAI105]PSO12872.1 pimeloyl-CoA dehydrogenase small subunit [Sphingobium sp. AEW4]TWD05721.1 alkylation response protein AidB-like acyl-CoA dehydrogenase [Sphingobium sp. AEW010]TWD23274.1 alkylation response protein AidB-like acyl-CoA dehydrogenase [Sphingobium sp. AEW013]TWD25134.1 alkylation response protein AidB-like acyl
MDFDFSEEQRLLGETVDRFVADRYDFAQREAILAQGEGWSADVWCALAELGLLGVGFAEADGGFGGGGIERMIIAEAFGRGLLLEPWLATVVLAGGALRRAGTAEQKEARIGAIIAGERIMVLAHVEPQGLRHTRDARALAVAHGEGYRITGEKIAVLHGGSAHELVVSARVGDETGLFLVDVDSPGVSRETVRGYDGVPVSTIRFEDAPAEALGAADEGRRVLAAVLDDAIAVLTAEAVGAMTETLRLTGDYLKTREQFGVALASFQALQHRMVDMYVQVELSRSAAIHAALACDDPSGGGTLHIAAAKAQAGRAGRLVGQNAIQLHGAIGFTAEHKVGHLFKRLAAIDALFGDADHHIDRIAEAGGLPPLS